MMDHLIKVKWFFVYPFIAVYIDVARTMLDQ